MAAVTTCSDLGPQENKICHCFHIAPHQFAMKWWSLMLWSSFFEYSVLSELFHSLLSSSSTGSLVPLCFLQLKWYHLHIWGCWYFSKRYDSGLWRIQPRILHDVLWISSEAIYSLNILLFHILNQSVVPCSVLAVASWPAYRFLRRQVRWFCIPISLRIFHSMMWSIQSKNFR